MDTRTPTRNRAPARTHTTHVHARTAQTPRVLASMVAHTRVRALLRPHARTHTRARTVQASGVLASLVALSISRTMLRELPPELFATLR